MLMAEIGVDWKSKISEFDPKPFAAASIGQVHLGKLLDGRPVAIKIQYPGVGDGINSDIDNLISVLNVWKIIPDGKFADLIQHQYLQFCMLSNFQVFLSIILLRLPNVNFPGKLTISEKPNARESLENY